ncbi:MAG: amino acid adenylation domain-containing protein [Gammaproteobacteria bacterium]
MAKLIHHWLEHHASARPDAQAATFVDQSLDFATLDARANRLANSLLEHGVARGDRIGIFMDKSLFTPVALHGILKAGAAYVPIDPSAPPGRVAAVIKDAGIRIVISGRDKRRALRLITPSVALDLIIGVDDPALGTPCVSLEALDSVPATKPNVELNRDDLAYIIFTSGSTGTPKGMAHTHASCLAFSQWAVEQYALTADDRLSNHAPLHFDLSILDYFAGVIAGCATVIIPEEYTRLPASYATLIEEQKVSVLYTVPFALIQLVLRGAIDRYEFKALRWVIFGGEAFAPDHLRALMDVWPHASFDNIYGPAEVNGVTHYTVPGNFDGTTAVPIGPVAEQAHGVIVDADDRPVASGSAGELLMASPTMMREYWQAPELNARAFVTRDDDGTPRRYFRTGDLVSRDARGVLEFIGRKDRQVKVRGYRIELDEIELALSQHEDVVEAAVYSIDSGDGTSAIHARATLQDASCCDESILLRFIKDRLPWYAIPASLSTTNVFPRTTSGKIDRRALAQGHTAQS